MAAACCWKPIACNGRHSLGAEGAYGKIIRVELLHKLHDELKYDGLDALTAGIAKDCADARAYFASGHALVHRDPAPDHPRPNLRAAFAQRARACGPASPSSHSRFSRRVRPDCTALRSLHVR